ncbi:MULTISPECIES: sensor domain-containing protein [Giesbergeria]|uniref:EAL domain-containing protein n=1 Tax=Giesbergeria sinuosa TaxID=80883 RepID=A0ABV9QC27_9BURK
MHLRIAPPMVSLTASAATRISLIYFVLASVWIWGSDWLTQALPSPEVNWWGYVQSWKGQFFVLLTTVLLFLLVGREERRQAALLAELREIQSRLEHLVDVSPTVIYAMEQSGATQNRRWTYVSGNVRGVTGYDPEEILGADDFWWSRLHPDDHARVREALATMEQGANTFAMHYRWQHQDGSYRWMEDQASINRDANGQVLEVVGNWRDVSFEVHAREEMRSRQELLATFADHVPAAVALFDRDMHYVLASQRWLDDYGLNAQPMGDGSRYGSFPQMPQRWQQAHQQAFAGKVTRCEEDQWVRDDGAVQWLRWEARPCTTVNGQVQTIAILTEDITQIKRDQVLLQASEERWRFAIDGSDLGLWDWDVATGTVLFSTRWKSMLGYEEAEVGSALSEWETRVHPEDMPRVMEDVQQLLQGHTTFYSNEHRVLCKDGRYKWILDRGKVVQRDDNGQPLRVIGTHTDLTELKQREAALDLHAGVFMNSLEAIVICGPDNTIKSVNQAFTEITGYSAEEVLGHPPSFIASGRHDQTFYNEMWRQVQNAGRWQGEIWNRRKNGEVFVEWLTVNVDRASTGEIRHYYAIFSDITQRKQDQDRIRHITQHDALTDLPNRTVLRDRLELALSHAQRQSEPLSVLFLDLDRFKNINDSLGPRVGDALLIEVGKRLRQAVREQDTVSRQGGDEFTLLLPQVNADGAAHVAQKLLDELSQPMEVGSHQLVVPPSIGIAVYPADGKDADGLLQASDMAMYRAKNAGGNTFRFHKAEMQQRVSRVLQLENALHRALRNDELLLHFQPQLQLTSNAVIGCEALIRWQHPEMGLLSPAEFIPIAEESRLILPMGDWVLQAAASQCKAWQQAGLPPIVMAVNVSALQFSQPDFAQRVDRVLQITGLDACWLEIELTESVMAEDPERVIVTIQQLHGLGVRLSIDDFGTGYSSLAYLKRFSIHKLKIDQSFVRDLMTGTHSASIAEAIISMSRSLGLSTIAEGIETQEQAQWLTGRGCDQGQGYLFSKPMPAAQFQHWFGAKSQQP